MKLFSVAAVLVASAASTVMAAGVKGENDTHSPLKDDFYKPTDDYQSKKAGEILKSRKAPLDYKLDGIDKAYQLMYRTTDSLNNASYAVTALMIPKNAKKDRFVSYQVAEDASYAPCAPSFALTQSNGDDAMQDLLNEGIPIVMPDYEGPNSAFTAGRIAGHAVLDAIRAVLDFKDSGLDKNPKYAIQGYSGGALATGWAAELQPSYAPELNIVGTAVGGFVTNVSAVAENVNDGLGSGFLPAGILGMAAEYPAVASLLKTGLNSNNGSVFLRAEKQCSTQSLLEFAMQDIFSYFQSGEDVLEMGPIAQVLKNLTLGVDEGAAPKSPMYIYEGEDDEIVPLKIVGETLSSYCETNKDISVMYNILPKGTHTTTEARARANALKWLIDRLDGKKAEKGCTTTTTNMKAPATESGSGSNSTASASATGGSSNSTGSNSASSTGTSSSGAASGSASGSTGAGSALQTTPLMLVVGLAVASLF